MTRWLLWAGWSVELPACTAQRNPDGSWSAWGEDWALDVHIFEVGGTVSADKLLGDVATGNRRDGDSWIGTERLLVEQDNGRLAYRLMGEACATSTILQFCVSYLSTDRYEFARAVVAGIAHDAG